LSLKNITQKDSEVSLSRKELNTKGFLAGKTRHHSLIVR